MISGAGQAARTMWDERIRLKSTGWSGDLLWTLIHTLLATTKNSDSNPQLNFIRRTHSHFCLSFWLFWLALCILCSVFWGMKFGGLGGGTWEVYVQRKQLHSRKNEWMGMEPPSCPVLECSISNFYQEETSNRAYSANYDQWHSVHSVYRMPLYHDISYYWYSQQWRTPWKLIRKTLNVTYPRMSNIGSRKKIIKPRKHLLKIQN